MASEHAADGNERLLTILTTEHFALQMTRGSTISESNGRVGSYLTVLSGAVIAIGLLGGVADPSVRGLAGLVLLATVYFIGVATLIRVLETGTEDLRAAYGINRIRHMYGELEPTTRRLTVMSDRDDFAGVARNMGIPDRQPGQLLFTAGGMILVVNAVIGAATVVLALTIVGLELPLAAPIGGSIGALSFVIGFRRQRRWWIEALDDLEVLFPTTDGQPRITTTSQSLGQDERAVADTSSLSDRR